MGHLWFLLLLSVRWPHSRGVSGAAGHSLPGCLVQLEFKCIDGSCIPRSKLCDGRADCEDGSDEQRCNHVRCKKDEFTCRSRRCISTRFLCNGVDDCGDGSDEDSCQKCTAGLFSCGPFDVCLARDKLCNERTDCKDGRDETPELCGSNQPRPQSSYKCAASEFQCGDGQCIRQAWRCDHAPDCSDGSDEDNCDQNECLVNNGGCSYGCEDQKMGFVCYCPENTRLVKDSQCEEVDTCLETDVCDQLCVHENSSFTCDCHEGYAMVPETRECKAKGNLAEVVFTSSEGAHRMSVTGTDHVELAHTLSGLGPVAALASNHTLYWARRGRGPIYRISVDGKPHNATLLLKVRGTVSGLAVDWIHQLLYWTGVESDSINVGLLDGSIQRQLITGLDKPSAVAVDPLRGFLFWAQCGRFPKIERAALDGRDTVALVTSSIRCPVALSVDMPRQLLYWADQRSISRVNFEGRDRKTVVESNGYLDRPFGLAVFEGFVYWSEEVTRSICRANKHNGSQLQILLKNVASPGGVVVIHPVLQPDGSSVCGRPGTACQHGCVVNLLSESPEFSCVLPDTGQSPQETPAVTVQASSSSDPAFTGVLSLIIFLSLLLVGMAVCWWREEFRPSRALTVQSFYLKESQDPLIIIQGPKLEKSVNSQTLKDETA